MTLWHFLNEARTYFIIDADAPGRTRGDLFAGNEPISKPTMHGRRTTPRISAALWIVTNSPSEETVVGSNLGFANTGVDYRPCWP